MRDNYEACLDITLKWEGGDANHPDDPGGKTRWGITQATYNAFRKAHHLSAKSVFTMTRPEMLDIYKQNYWNAVKGDTLARGVDLATWDYGVNSGPSRARKTLLSVIGGTDVQTVQKLCAKRLSFVRGLGTWKVFGKGWSRRIADIEARGVKMALGNKLPPASCKPALNAEGNKAAASANGHANVAVGSGGLATCSGASDALSSNADQLVSLTLLGLVGVGIAVGLYFLWRSRHNKERAKAYARVAAEIVT